MAAMTLLRRQSPFWEVLKKRSSGRTAEGGIRVAVLQGNIDQYKKWDRSYVREILEVYSALSGEAASRVWAKWLGEYTNSPFFSRRR